MYTQQFMKWIYKIAENKAKDFLRYRDAEIRMPKGGFVYPDGDEDQEKKVLQIPSFQPLPDEQVISGEQLEIARLAIEKLPEGTRRAFILYYIENLTHKEIAKCLGISVDASKRRVSRGTKKVKKMLKTIVPDFIKR